MAKMKLKRKNSIKKFLSDEKLTEAISDVTAKYKEANFHEIALKLDEEYREIFENSRYEYLGFTSQLGMIGDIDIHFKVKGSK